MARKLIFIILFSLLLLKLILATTFEDQEYWFKVSNDELQQTLKNRLNYGKAKNLIIFIGDGMSITTVTAARIYSKGEPGHLSWEKFPFTGLIKTYNTDNIVPDSSSTATAIFSGVKINQKTVGLDINVQKGDCLSSIDPRHHVDGLFTWAQDAGKSTGFVTTTRVVHATPAALYAHSPQRNWECEAKIPLEYRNICRDIGRQLIEDSPGRDINVIMGGGRQCLVSNSSARPNDPIDTWTCIRKDGRDLMKTWKENKDKRDIPNAVVQNTGELRKVNYEETEYLMGIFSNGHMNFDDNRDTSSQGMPSLKEMVDSALKILRKNGNGFVLMVEGGLIDYAHHLNYARRSLRETEMFSEAVEHVTNLMGSDTLLVVTSDHAHSLSIVGHPERGKGVLGMAGISKFDSIPYTTLAYASGYDVTANFTVWEDGSIHREDPSKLDTTSYSYHHQSAIVLDEAYHDGSDVAVYAKGPWAHLFTSVHEQTYLAHAMAYSLRVGPYADRPLFGDTSTANFNHSKISSVLHIILLLIIHLYLYKLF